MSAARSTTKPKDFPSIVRQLTHNSTYAVLLNPLGFPKSLSELEQKRNKLSKLTTAGELMWCGSILAQHSKELNTFVKNRDKFYETFLCSNYDEAKRLLDDIQEKFGYSLWLIKNRLQLLQEAGGLQAQKSFLEELVNTKGINQFIAWLSYFLSIRAEENVSYSGFEHETEELMDVDWLHDYVILHLLPYKFTDIKDPGSPILVEELHPIIDRFETFVSMSLLYCVKYDDKQVLISALEQTENIGDHSLRQILMVLRDGYSVKDANVMQLVDTYTEGRYQETIASDCECLELMVRAYALAGQRPPLDEKPSLRQRAIALMHDIISLVPDAPQNRKNLKKIALISPSRSFSFQIAAFLERERNYIVSSGSSNLDLTAALSNSFYDPWISSALERICKDEMWLDQLLRAHPNSSTLKLRQAVTLKDEGMLEKELIPLPWYRKKMYLGHIYFEKGDFKKAISCYQSACDYKIDFVSHNAKRYLFDAYIAANELNEAVQLTINQIINTSSAAQSYPLENLAKEYLNQPDYRKSMDLAILLSFSIRYSGAKLERKLSNIYENVLAARGITRPSELSEYGDKYNHDRLVYFLRFICVQRVLDDTISYDTVEEMDKERIAVCQLLLQLDPQNLLVYQEEIRILTREIEVSNLLTKIQASMIFVDEAGIREFLETSLRDLFIRYKKLLDSPELAFQAEKLSKRLIEMLNRKDHPEFQDLKLPATELEGLFNAILLEAISEFAINPAYGLDTHISTSIRHGAFEGHLRNSFDTQCLLCHKKDKDYILPAIWHKKLPNLGEQDFYVLLKLLTKFTQLVEGVIHEYLDKKLHVRQVGDNVAMFNFYSSSSEIQNMMTSMITHNTTLNELIDRLIIYCWKLTNESLDTIRADLHDNAAKKIGLACDSLVKSVENKFNRNDVIPLVDSIVRARTSFLDAVEDVAEWFQRPTNLDRDPFEIEVAIHVALQQIANCYGTNRVNEKLNLNVDGKIDGKKLNGLCGILFILIQNVILHSGQLNKTNKVDISAERNGDLLNLKCNNRIGREISLEECRERANEAMDNYEHDSALNMARKEGGSGLSKVWRIAEFDLCVSHQIELIVTDNREFIVKLSLEGIWDDSESIHS